MTYQDLPLKGGAVEYANFAAFPAGSGTSGLAWDSGGTSLYFDSPLAGTWVLAASTAGGEANTGANVNLTGVGVFETKTGVQLQFRGITAASSKLSVALNVGNKSVDVDVVEANLTLDNIGGTLSISKGGTGSTTAANARTALGITPANIGAATTAHAATHYAAGSDPLTGSLDANARLAVTKAAVAVGTRRGLNLIEGTGVTMTVADNAGAERVDVTISTSGEANTASNLGAGAQLFASKVGVDLQFKSLTNGGGISFATSGTEVQLSVTGRALDTEAFLTVGNTGGLSNERAIAVSHPLSATDGGAGNSYTIAMKQVKDVLRFWDDFLMGASGGWTATSTGTASTLAFNTTSDGTHPGIWALVAGTTATGRSAISSSLNAFATGMGAIRLDWIVRMPALSDGTVTYSARIGAGDSATNTESTDAIFFRYTHTENSGNWSCVTRAANVETSTNSASAVAANTWVRLGIQVNAAGTSVGFYVNGTLVATNTTNIPSSTQQMGLLAIIVKTVGTGGTSTRTLEVDAVEMDINFTSSR